MSIEEKQQKIFQIIANEIGDDCYLSLIIFTNEAGDLWRHSHQHNFEREAVIMALRSTADALEEFENNNIPLN